MSAFYKIGRRQFGLATILYGLAEATMAESEWMPESIAERIVEARLFGNLVALDAAEEDAATWLEQARERRGLRSDVDELRSKA